jgi:hypothetical protein
VLFSFISDFILFSRRPAIHTATSFLCLTVAGENIVMASSQFDEGPDTVLLRVNNPSLIPANRPRTERSQLGAHFQPGDYSVICGQGNASSNYTENRRFRVIASIFMEKYSLATCNKHKSTVAANIVTMIRQGGGSFCIYEHGAWFEVGDYYAHEIASTLFHDMLHTQCRSSAKAKTTRCGARSRQNKTQKQQYSQQLVGEDTGRLSDDSSMSSLCSGRSTDSLGFDNSLELDFFDIDVF